MLRVNFVTLFPQMILDALGHSMTARAEKAGLAKFSALNPRNFATDTHRTVDDSPYGGGPGMVIMPGPISEAIESIPKEPDAAIVFAEPTGRLFDEQAAQVLSGKPQIIFVCGHYEGIDHRVQSKFATHVFSIGDYVLTGGELPALVMCDAVVRLLPGVLGDDRSLQIDSHANGLLSAHQYTRPEIFEGEHVPEILLSGDHAAVESWRRRQALRLTRELRPDLFCSAPLDKNDLDLLSS